MYCVGLTGTIASGKSTVGTLFAALGVSVISADQIAREITVPNSPAFHSIVQHFGTSVVSATGDLNRRRLRDVIFNNPAERLWLETCLHPLIRQQIQEDVHTASGPYCLIEIPLLTANYKADYPYINRVLLVQTNPAQQIARIMQRDDSTRKQALTILASQPDESQYSALADDRLMNDGSLPSLQTHIAHLHAQYLKKATHVLSMD